jgi:drug/metabolite transporter (DMT)-like permease
MALDLKKDQYVPALVILMFLWALVIPLSKLIVEDAGAPLLSFLRNALGAIAIFIMIVIRGREVRIDKQDYVPLIVIGIIGTAIASLLMFIGVDLSTATNAAILVNTNPIFVAILAPFLISEHLSRRQFAGILLAFIGIVLVTTNGMGIADFFGSQMFIGNLILVVSGLCIALYTIYGKKYVKRYGGLVATFYTVLAGAIFLLIYNIITGDISRLLFLSLEHWIIIFYIGAIVTGFVYALWYKSIKFIGASRAASFKLLIPVFAAAVSIAFLGETPSGIILFGGFLVVLGLFYTQKGK